MEIIEATTPQHLKEFVELPYRLYRHDPMWVPPLKSEQMAQFDRKKNPMLDHCTTRLFLASHNGAVVGRVAAFTDQLAMEHWLQPIGLFGSYECENNPEASQLLLQTARDWLVSQGMIAMRGPWSFASQEWGLVVEGYTPAPVIMAPYNPPYYNDQLTAFGLQKAKDLIVYEADVAGGYQVPERYLTMTERIAQRYGVKVRGVRMDRLEEDVMTLVDVANRSICDNWGFYPVTPDEARAMARDLKQVVNPRALLIAELADGTPIGFAMSLPDINLVLKGMRGSLLPFGWLKMLTQLPRIQQYRMWALGVIPEYQGRAIDTLLYRATYDAIYSEKLRLEINYVLEDNDRMNNALMRLGVTPIRRYRVYEMTI